MTPGQITVVLCRPQEPGNIGAVCRAMKNMALSRLSLVLPERVDEARILERAVHAEDVWRGAALSGSLEEALAGYSLCAGITRRRGAKRKTTMSARELAAFLQARAAGEPAASYALVFGNERTGLDQRELELCDIASHIPADEAFPSLNLSHAVQVYAYELFCARGGAAGDAGNQEPPGQWKPLSRAELDSASCEVYAALKSVGFYKQGENEAQRVFFRDIMARAGITRKEAEYIKNITLKAAKLSGSPSEGGTAT